MSFSTMKKIQSVTVGSGGAANMQFTNIPGTFDDLIIKTSIRNSGTTLNSFPSALFKFNTSSANFSARLLYGDGSGTGSLSNTTGYFASINNNNTTSSTNNTFASVDIYIPNYTGSTNKSFSAESVTETNGTTAYSVLTAGLWSQTSTITSIEIYLSADNLLQHSTAVLYGIKRN